MVDTGNIRMLSMYYSAQNVYKNDLAAPLLSAIRPLINVQEHSISLLVEKVVPNLDCKVEFKKLQERICKNFARIDCGKIKPDVFLGHRMETDEIVDNSLKHDAYSAIYKGFFKELSILRYDCADGVRDEFINRIMNEKLGLTEREKMMMQNAISNFKRRPPISLGLDAMKDLVDVMHDCVTLCCGPDIADITLSTAIKEAERAAPKFSAQNFI